MAIDRYVEALVGAAENLGASGGRWRQVSSKPDLKYQIFQRRSKGNGHVVVFRVEDLVLEVVSFFHTSQDLENKL